jgi:hypothetical protein
LCATLVEERRCNVMIHRLETFRRWRAEQQPQYDASIETLAEAMSPKSSDPVAQYRRWLRSERSPRSEALARGLLHLATGLTDADVAYWFAHVLRVTE